MFDDLKIRLNVGMCCFYCNKSVQPCGHFILLNREKRTRCAGGEDKRFGGMATYQMCISCAKQPIENHKMFRDQPVHLQQIEKDGLFAYLKELRETGAITQDRELEEKECSFCGVLVEDGMSYIELEIHEEINYYRTEVVPGTRWILGMACEQCTENLLLWV
ncbi:MAG: hypothetical protein WC958_00390 [Dehalococcoidales bacterium]